MNERKSPISHAKPLAVRDGSDEVSQQHRHQVTSRLNWKENDYIQIIEILLTFNNRPVSVCCELVRKKVGNQQVIKMTFRWNEFEDEEIPRRRKREKSKND